MPDAKKCPQCGATLPAGALEGLCPACLLAQGAAPDTATQAGATPFVPPTVEEVARFFPQLEILAFIGKGGMGAVYKARQPALDRIVALKILPPQAAAARFAERFNREARALAKLNHPNIVAVHEFGQVNGLPFFIMEYVDGLNLRQLEKAGRLSPREALQIVPQICEALQFAHDEGIVHRDIKPENILLDKKGRVKIADFGIAKIMGREPDDAGVTETQHAVGTPRYMAPEQVEKPGAVDHRADIFSLGVVFYEMLTGELPLGKFAPPSRKVQVDVRLDEVVLRALEKEPELRFQQASEVKTAVDTIAGTAAPASKFAPEPARAQTTGGLRNGWYTLGWIVAGILGSIFLLAISPFLFGATALVLALFFGIMSWRERLGKVIVAMVASLFLVAAGIALISIIFIAPARRAALQARMMEQFQHSLAAKSDYIGQVFFPLGDSIEITSVERSPEQMVVKGRYRLVSSDTARLALSIASRDPGSTPVDPKQAKEISRGQGDFELIHTHLVPGLPHVSMYDLRNGGTFADLYFGTKEEALRESTQKFRQPPMESWSPALGPGEKPDLQKIRSEAKTMMEQGRYEESLQRQIWCFHNALQYGEVDAVRLSFGLADWAELGRRYPRAKQAMIEIRDRNVREFSEGRGSSQLFSETAALNRELQDDAATLSLFKNIHQLDKQLAGQCFFYVEDLLIQKREYALGLDCIGSPQTRFESLRTGFELQKESRQATDNFVGQVCKLIEILVGADRQTDAEKIRDQALAVLDDPRLKSAVSDAENNVSARMYRAVAGDVWVKPGAESQEILRLKLQATDLNLQEAEKKLANGLIPQSDYDEAKFQRDLAAAELKGDAALAARVKLDFAELKLQEAEKRRATGTIPQSDYDEAKFQRDLAAAELKGDAREIARVKLQDAELKLQNAEKLRANGIISQGEYDQAKLMRDMLAAHLRGFGESKDK